MTEKIEEYRRAVPARPDGLTDEQIDLSQYYTTGPKYEGPWEHLHAHGLIPNGSASRSYNYEWAPSGVKELNGVLFDVRGVCQAAGLSLVGWNRDQLRFPQSIGPIPIGRRAEKLYFLQAAIWPSEVGTLIGRYMVEFANGEFLEVPIVYGIHVGESVELEHGIDRASQAAVHVFGENSSQGMLYTYTWENPHPAVEVKSVKLVSAMSTTAPALVALTLEAPED